MSTNALVIASSTHQAFGHWSGWALDNAVERSSLDGLVGWAEEARVGSVTTTQKEPMTERTSPVDWAELPRRTFDFEVSPRTPSQPSHG
ncbi:MAG: DUF2804 family protein [Myxococcaceae bacterium]|nr:DUF2804 family protein [Myxococcaceae bacterium]